MQEVLARLKLEDRTLLITRPVAYLGRSGSDFDGSLTTYLTENSTQDQNYIQFLPISQDEAVPEVAAKITFDFLTLDFAIENCNRKASVVVDDLELLPDYPQMNYVHLVHQSIICINQTLAHFQLTSFARLYVNKLRQSLSPPAEKAGPNGEKKPEDIFEQQHKLMRNNFNVNDIVAQICETVVPPLMSRISAFGGQLPGIGLSSRKNVKVLSQYVMSNRAMFETKPESKRHLKIKEKQNKKIKKAEKNSRLPPFHKEISLYNALEHFFEMEGETNPAVEQKQAPAPGTVVTQLKKRGRPKKTQVQETRVLSEFEKRKHAVFIKKSKKKM